MLTGVPAECRRPEADLATALLSAKTPPAGDYARGTFRPRAPVRRLPARYAQLWAAWPGARVLRPELRPTLAPAYAGNSGGSRTPPLLNAAGLPRLSHPAAIFFFGRAVDPGVSSPRLPNPYES